MNENLCIAIITTASIFAGFLVAFLSSYLTARNKEYDENKLKFDTLGRKLTLFRQLCGFIWNSNCLNEQRGKLKANEPALDEDGNVKSFMHAIDALHRDLKLKQYKQNPYIDYSEEDLDRIKIFVNSIWYNLIHKNYQEVHFSQLLDCPMGISPGYFTTIRKELSFGNRFSDEGMDDKEFGNIAGNVECEVIEDMEVLQYEIHKPIDCDVIAIIDSESISTAVLDSSIAKARIQIIGYDYCNDVEGIFKKYFNSEKPFGKKGKQKEFPDAFVLSALEQYAKKNRIENIILLSHDGDMFDYKSDVLIQKEIGEYLNGILKEIATSEAEKRDIERLYAYFHKGYLQLIIPQYFISNKSGIWSLSLIVHSKG